MIVQGLYNLFLLRLLHFYIVLYLILTSKVASDVRLEPISPDETSEQDKSCRTVSTVISFGSLVHQQSCGRCGYALCFWRW
jgi:hypothetical protein